MSAGETPGVGSMSGEERLSSEALASGAESGRSRVLVWPSVTGGGGAELAGAGTAASIGCPLAAAASAASSSAISFTEEKRWARSRASTRAKKASMPGGRSGASSVARGMGSARTLASTAPSTSPGKGSLPVRARKVMTPSDQRSARGSRSLSQRTCSGLM